MSTVNPGADDQRAFISSLFDVELDGIALADVMSVGGLSLDVQDVTIETVDDGKHFTEYTPGLVSYPELTIKRTFRGDKTLWDWFEKVMTGKNDIRKTGSVVVYDLAGKEVSRWNFQAAWPSKWAV